MKKHAFIFPGQGSQYVGMGKDFADAFPIARQTFEQANDVLGRNLSKIIFEGPLETLTETHNSQVAIYVNSMAIWFVLQELYPKFKPKMTAGLSLGEYTALTVSGRIAFEEGLKLVQARGKLMSDACNHTKGTMAVILGLTPDQVEQMVEEMNLPKDLWAANFNCPGQVVISGTAQGIALGAEEAKKRGAKRVLPIQVHGAFHSGLMAEAEKGLAAYLLEVQLHKSSIALAMNVTGGIVKDAEQIRLNLMKQVTHPVRWQKCIEALEAEGADLFVEIGSGKTLTGFNKRIETKAPTISIEKVEDLDQVEQYL